MVAHRRLSSAMRSNDDNDWSIHSLLLSHMIHAVFLCDNYNLGAYYSLSYDLWQRVVMADMTEP